MECNKTVIYLPDLRIRAYVLSLSAKWHEQAVREPAREKLHFSDTETCTCIWSRDGCNEGEKPGQNATPGARATLAAGRAGEAAQGAERAGTCGGIECS